MTADTPTPNPFLEAFNQTTASLDPDRLKTIFHDSTSPDERGVLFNEMCDAGESLVNEFGWAVPTERVLTILKHFSPIVEIGSGANAYLGHLSKAAMIDINCYDIAPLDGGLLTNNKKRKLTTSPKTSITLPGGPSVLQNPENKNKTLLLCFPDQFLQEDSDIPMALSALKNFTGEHIIHIGELYGDTVAHDHQAPFGRSSSPDFQIQLATDFHCLLKIELPHWPHEGTTCSVWKRTKTCELVFDDDEDSPDDDDTESNSNSDSLKYANIPPNEQLPRTISTPSTRHLCGLPCCKNVELTLLPETFMVAKFPCDSAEGMIIASNILVKGERASLLSYTYTYTYTYTYIQN